MWNRFEGYEAMKGAKGDCDNLRILRRASHENRAEEVVGLWSIYRANDNISRNVWGGEFKARTGCKICGGLFWGCPQDS